MLESLIAQLSSTLCRLSSDLHQLLQLQNPNNNRGEAMLVCMKAPLFS